MSLFSKNIILISTFIFFSACSEQNVPEVKKQPVEKKLIVESRNIDPAKYSQGSRIYQLNCAKCHGKHAEGDKDWRKLNEKGKYPPPPLNGTGHTWHHSTKVLVNTIKNGTAKIGGSMPAWKDKLSGKDIEAVLAYVQAQWSDEIYTTWYNNFHKEK